MPRDNLQDAFDLDRFVREQEGHYAQALAELRSGRKQSHWMWFVLPQMKGLGWSEMSEYFGVSGREEAQAYLAHPVLGYRLVECILAILDHPDTPAATLLGEVDALKYRSCLTLFELATEPNSIFTQALQVHFDGQRDERTLALIFKGSAA